MTPPFRVQLSPEARLHVATINLWWAQNRPAAPTLVASEFQTAIEQLSQHPDSGRVHQDRGRHGVRKLLLSKDKSTSLHFDVAHLHMIPWSGADLSEYTKRLESHIVAVLGRGPVKPQPLP